MSFLNKVVIVTGASSGIGAATAIAFAKEGANVAIVDRNEAKLKNIFSKIEATGKTPLMIKRDVSIDDDAKKIIEETIGKFGKLDVLVNSAGIVRKGSILKGNLLQSYDEVMHTNIRAVINLTTLAAPHLIQTKGNIVNISSVASKVILSTDSTAYCISKCALDHFTKSAAKELAASGVRVNSINPGPVRTDLMENAKFGTPDMEWMAETTALKRISDPEEIAELILYFAGEKAKGITGSNIVADNGTLIK